MNKKGNFNKVIQVKTNKQIRIILRIVALCFFLVCGTFLILTNCPHAKQINIEYPGPPMGLSERWLIPGLPADLNAYHNALQRAKEQRGLLSARTSQLTSWRLEGPTNICGRINCIAVCPNDTLTFLAGSPAGGLFKSTDGANTWRPVFDEQLSLSIGCVTYSPSNPNDVYVGTGDPNVTGFTFTGDGVYKSADGGETWTHLGLDQTRIISKIIVDPLNSNVIYVAALGNPFQADSNRGIYKSSDGGLTWTQSLFVSPDAGVVDLAMDNSNSQILYASSLERIQSDTQQVFNGNNSKIWKTTDGGTTWQQLNNGLPAGKHSRIAIAINPSLTSTVYACLSDSTNNCTGIYQSTNAGMNWSLLSNDAGLLGGLNNYFWYFGKMFVNSSNANEIFIPSVQLWYSGDGGTSWAPRTFISQSSTMHEDIHDLIFVGNSIYIATDGGIFRTTNQMTSWNRTGNFPVTQFYHVGLNPWKPGIYYGGAQDNGMLMGNAAVISAWQKHIDKDGFQPLFDQTDSLRIYAEFQGGEIFCSTDGGVSYHGFTSTFGRTNWDTPFINSTDNPGILYAGDNKVEKLTSAGTISSISPDLTDGNLHPNEYGYVRNTITSLSESVIDPDVFYAGTSDGNVWLGNRTGNLWSWFSITGILPDRYVTAIRSSPNQVASVYVTHSGYRSDQYMAHIHHSDDYGNTWLDITGDLPPVGVNDLVILPGNENVLFAATDAGVYYTVNAGMNWEPAGTGMPLVPVFDIEFDSTEHRLVAGTFGRSLMTLSVDSLLENPQPVLPQSLTMYPTLATNQLYFSVGNNVSQTIQGEIYSMDGKKVKSFSSDNSPEEVDISSLAQGIYVAVVFSGEEKFTAHFMKYGK